MTLWITIHINIYRHLMAPSDSCWVWFQISLKIRRNIQPFNPRVSFCLHNLSTVVSKRAARNASWRHGSTSACGSPAASCRLWKMTRHPKPTLHIIRSVFGRSSCLACARAWAVHGNIYPLQWCCLWRREYVLETIYLEENAIHPW